MFIYSYKDYLRLLEKRPRISPFGKIFILIFGVLFIIAGIFSAVTYYQYKKELPIKAQNQYLDLSYGGFISVSQSIEELAQTFKVAGAKTQLIEKSKESSAQASGFFVSLDDSQKTLSKIQSTKENIKFQKNLLRERIIPEVYLGLNNDLLNFYEESEILFNNLSSDYQFTKELLLALGPDFYLPALTNESLWSSGKEQEIIDYYQKIKESASVSLEKFQKLLVPDNFRTFYDTQLKYFELVINVSNNIINTLQSQNDTDVDSATQIEKAYQLLVGASRENEQISQKLLEEKLKLIDQKKNIEQFSSLNLSQNSLQANFADHFKSQPQTKMDQIKIWPSVQKFFRGFTSVY
jgi:hypothetical protein